MLIPKPLKKGDTVALIAPASKAQPQRVELAVNVLEGLGLLVKPCPSCYFENHFAYTNDSLKAAEINGLFEDKEIKGIFAVRGGYGCQRLLNMIDFRAVRDNPKVFVGYSDITALHVAINQRAELATFHAPMPGSDLFKCDSFSMGGFMTHIFGIFNKEETAFAEIKNPKGFELHSLSHGKAVGSLVGGNLTIISTLMGTPYEIDTKDKILFLEDVSEEPYRIDRALTQLSLAGKLDDAAGIVLGMFTKCEKKNEDGLTLRSIFEHHFSNASNRGKPALMNLYSGHCMPNITLPMGKMASIEGGRLYVRYHG